MIVLDNIEKHDGYITADHYSLDDNDRGHVSYDIEKDCLFDVVYNKEDEGSITKYPFGKSLYAMRNLAKSDKELKTYHYLWY